MPSDVFDIHLPIQAPAVTLMPTHADRMERPTNLSVSDQTKQDAVGKAKDADGSVTELTGRTPGSNFREQRSRRGVDGWVRNEPAASRGKFRDVWTDGDDAGGRP